MSALNVISQAAGYCVDKTPIFVDIDGSVEFGIQWKAGQIPCLTASRASAGGHWVSTRSRRLTTDEMFRFQGLDPREMQGWSDVMTRPQVNHAIGNAMSGNVLRRIVIRAMYSAGLVKEVCDPWHDKAYCFFH